jgi:hypothetical protein
MRKSKVVRRAMNRRAAPRDQSPWHVVSTRPPRSASQRSANFRPRPPAGGVAGRLAAPHVGARRMRASGGRQREGLKAKEPAFRPALSLARCLKRHYPPPNNVTRNPSAPPPCSVPRSPRATEGMLRRACPTRRVFPTYQTASFPPVQPKCHTRSDIGRERGLYVPPQASDASLMIAFGLRDARFGTDQRWA